DCSQRLRGKEPNASTRRIIYTHQIDVGLIAVQPNHTNPLVIQRNTILVGAFGAVTDYSHPSYKGAVHKVVQLMGKLIALPRTFILGELKILSGLLIFAALSCLKKTKDRSVRSASAQRIGCLGILVVLARACRRRLISFFMITSRLGL